MNNAVKNAFSLVGGQVVNLILSLLSITLAARFLGVENFGKFSALLAIVTIISKAFDFGFAPIVFRELSIKKNNYTFLNSSIVITFILFLCTAFIFNVTLLLLDTSSLEIILLNLLLINTIFSVKFVNLRELLQTPFKANLRMHIPISVAILDNIIFLVLVLLLPTFEGGLTYFILSYVVSNIPGFLVMLVLLKTQYDFKLKFNFKDYRWLIKESLPIYGFILLDVLYQQLDILFLKYFHSDYAVGIYSVSMRLVFPLIIIPTAIIHTVFPIISQNLGINDDKVHNLITLIYKFLFSIAFIFAAIFSFGSQEIIVLVFGINYVPSNIPTIFLFWSQLLFYYSFFTMNLFVAYNKQSWNFVYALLILGVNITFSLILIPSLSYVGASIAKLITAFAGFSFFIIIHYKFKSHLYVWSYKSIFWAIIVLFSIGLASFLPLSVYLIFSVLISVVLIFIMKFYTEDELLFLFSLINKKTWADKIIKLTH